MGGTLIPTAAFGRLLTVLKVLIVYLLPLKLKSPTEEFYLRNRLSIIDELFLSILEIDSSITGFGIPPLIEVNLPLEIFRFNSLFFMLAMCVSNEST